MEFPSSSTYDSTAKNHIAAVQEECEVKDTEKVKAKKFQCKMENDRAKAGSVRVRIWVGLQWDS